METTVTSWRNYLSTLISEEGSSTARRRRSIREEKQKEMLPPVGSFNLS